MGRRTFRTIDQGNIFTAGMERNQPVPCPEASEGSLWTFYGDHKDTASRHGGCVVNPLLQPDFKLQIHQVSRMF
ncbi:hypothetical protein TNIN_142221 [Trichonephila inaurata madagascariensis]|uniref:Uncharacterized protein n=1 Tax=Trichonephila inaurata madagascariensis TaxID=2747483 RepID=A0A8X6YJE9_9ARAC|nr:hypothetical protein TNIN_142221 [Trichonephila inaurata madagascariensis]